MSIVYKLYIPRAARKILDTKSGQLMFFFLKEP